MFLRNIAMTLFVTAVAAAPSMFAQGPPTNTTTTTRELAFGPIGLATTETVQVNVVNTAANSSTGTAASCTGSISFYNSAGNVIGTSSSFTVTAGQISSVPLAFGKATTGTTRVVVRPVVSLTTTNATPRIPCSLETSLETYDTTTGVTHVFLAGPGAGAPGGGFFGR